MTKDVYDHLLLEILQNEGQILPFLDVIFAFLYRRTDFYRIQKSPEERFGFPPGISEMLVRTAFTKYHKLALRDEEARQNQKDEEPSFVAEEVEIGAESGDASNSKNENTQQCLNKEPSRSKKIKTYAHVASESYNGAVRNNYSWSQTIQDLDVRIKVPESVKSGKEVLVKIMPQHITASVQENGEWTTVVDEDLRWKINVQESLWSLVPGEHVLVSLEKAQERWWDSLLVNEPKIDVTNLDTSQNYEDLDEESQACISQLMYDEQQKCLGKPTSQQLKVQQLLKEAWDKEGSPFKNQEFDPTSVTLLNPDELLKQTN